MTEDKIFFIRYGFEDKNDIINFIREIKKINSNLEVYFLNINYDEQNININYEINNYYYINLFNYLDYSKTYNNDLFFITMELNWYNVFEIINSNLEEGQKINYYSK